MTIKSELRTYGILLSGISVILLIVAVSDRASGYYQFLRLFITLTALITCYIAYKHKSIVITLISGTLAILFNPFAPVYLDKQTWQFIDGFVAIYFIVLFIILWFNSGERLVTRKAVRWIIGMLIVLALLVSAGVFVDYQNYKKGDWSHLFGTLDTYRQNQILKLYPLEVRVTEVERKNYAPVELITCADLPNKPVQYVERTPWPKVYEPKKWQEDCMGYGPIKHTDNYEEHIKTMTKTNLVVHFFYKNISSKAGYINNYEFYIEPSDLISDYGGTPKYPQGDAQPGVDNYANLNIVFPKDHTGSLWLVVRKGDETKKIQLDH